MTNLNHLYNKEVAETFFDVNYFVDKKLGFQVIENGVILPHKDVFVNGTWTWGSGGIVDNNGTFVKGSSAKSDVGKAYVPQQPIQYRNETVVYLGLFYHVWGHVITDNIRRLWFLKSADFKSEFKDCPLVYVHWEEKPLEKQQNFKRLLEILEINFENLQAIEQPTRFDKIILPDESLLVDKNYKFTIEYQETVEQVRHFSLKNRLTIPDKKIYYLHGMRNQVGEERLAEYFNSKGYEIVRPEKLTLDEQLNLLINCKSFASTIGSTSHNAIFLRDAVEAIFIPRFINRFTGYQGMINQIHSLNTCYIDSTMSIFATWTDFSLYIISKQLKDFFGDKFDGYDKEDFRAFLEYVKMSMSKGTGINSGVKKAYGATLKDFMEQLKHHEDLISSCNMPPRWEQFQPTLTYQTHIHTKGWEAWQFEEQISGFTEDKLDIQAIKVNFPNHKIYYSVYYSDAEGWSEEVKNGEQAGTTGKGKSIYGIRIRLDESGSKQLDILYRVHKFDGEWTAWAKNGEVIYSNGVKLNVIQIKLEPKT